MADITLKLMWYKLGESGGKMADWYDNLNWEDHVLDILLFGWIAWSVFLVIIANGLSKIIGPLRLRVSQQKRETLGGSNARVISNTESCQWLNHGISWFFLNYYRQAEFIDAWIKTLNVEVKKLGGPVQIKFEKLESGSLPPKFSDISSQIGQDDKFTIQGHVESRDMAFVVFASQTTNEGVKLTNCTAKILRLKGKVRATVEKIRGEVKVTAGFIGKPEIKTNVKPSNPFQKFGPDTNQVDQKELVDLGVVDEVVRNAIILASPTYNITDWMMTDPQAAGTAPANAQGGQNARGGQGQARTANQMTSGSNQLASTTNQMTSAANQYAGSANQFASDISNEVFLASSSPYQQSAPVAKPRSQPTKERLPRPEAVFEPIEARQFEPTFQAASVTPAKPPRTAGEKRLLVKVIKASGLASKETGTVEPVCLLLLDDPVQNYSTSAVKNTINPFWDEHFLFDVTQDTRELRLEVYDRAKSPGEEFIGESIVYIDDLRKTPSTRQILALQSRPGFLDNSCGALTVEFLFMDPSEADLLLDISAAASNQISPKRRIETGRTVTPGGTVVTTTRTTTEKSPYGNQDPGLDGSPHLVQKRHINADFSGSECSGESSSPFIITNDSSLSASSGPSPILQYDREPGRYNPTIESTPTDETGDMSIARDRQIRTPDKEKKKSTFGSALKKAFGRKKRAHSADRETSSYKEGRFLKPPEQHYGPQSKDDLELVRAKGNASPNLKKSRSLGGSLKKLFRRSRRRSKSRDNSRESSFKNTGSQNPSRDSSLNRSQNRSSVS
ncbi:C2 domain-containing protein 2 isoform X4 [Patella vulgata]|uniref:C2 domain-containing protein 2 isoform X4 n=1 Tax=Patella vulgata TaxID=6465 RepID=UPI002180531D|nr:C2 domain-containing protein 2 isoform X4 [Patella vulgata]